MTTAQHVRSVCIFACVALAIPSLAGSQGRRSGGPGTPVPPDSPTTQAAPIPPGADRAAIEQRLNELAQATRQLTVRTPAYVTDPMAGPVVVDAPFSADAATTVTQTLGDGTRIERNTTARFYRDKAGRVRREQTILGLDGLNPSGQMQTITIDPDPGDPFAYTLDPVARTARRGPRTAMQIGATNGGLTLNTFFVRTRTDGRGAATGTGPVEESLGTRQIEGVKATGRKTTTTIPTGQIGNDRPIEITDERWESPELKVLVYSRSSDPRTGVIEYRLTNITRADPPADLFMVPPDYTVIDPSQGGRGRGAREGGPGTVGR